VAFGFLATDASTMPQPPESYESRSFRFACDIVGLYRRLMKLPDVPHVIARQVLRAGTSVGANLEEAKAAQSRRDRASRFTVALKEARETSYWLRLIVATELADKRLVDPLALEANELIAILTTTRRKLSSQGNKEHK
jgi:four helix bundle protein